jgi:PAS domain S-box-containing protein
MRFAREWPMPWQYLIALGMVAAVLGARWLLDSQLGTQARFLPLLAALLPLAVMVRPLPFLAAGMAGFVGSWLLFVPPPMSLALSSVGPADRVILGFVAAALGATWVAAWWSERARASREDFQRLRRRERHLRLVSDVAPAMIVYVDRQLRYRFTNNSYESWFGLRSEEFIGRDVREVIGEEAYERVRPFVERALEGEHVEFEMAVPRGRDDVRILRTHYVPDLRDDGSIAGLYALITDVSERVQARRALAASEARYRTLFESIDEGFCILQIHFDDADLPIDFRAIEANPAVARQSGIQAAVGDSIREHIPELEPHWLEIFGKVALTRTSNRFVAGSRALGRCFDVYAFPIGDPDDRQVAVLFTDITARRNAESALASALADHERLQAVSCRLIPADDTEALYRELLEAMIQITQADYGSIQAVDEETGELRLLGATGQLQQVQSAIASMHGPCWEAARTRQRVLVDLSGDSGNVDRAIAQIYRALDINVVQATPLMTRSGRLVGVIASCWSRQREIPLSSLSLLDVLARQAADFIERTQAESARREADRRKDEFLAILAHELRNPLAGIRMATSVLGNTRDAPRHVEEMTAVIDRQSARLMRLIDDLMDVSRISQGKMTLRKTRVDLGEVVRQIATDALPVCEGRGRKTVAVLPKHPVPVEVDVVRIGQVITNLIQNACRFTPVGGNMELRLEREGDQAVLRVSDSGAGIPPDELTRIFGLFTQGEALAHPGDGLGIGLALARSIVDLHGGTIEARSEGVGKGSEFFVRLAICEPGALTANRGSAIAHPPSGLLPTCGRRIVAADDNRDALEALAILLRMKGHEVTTAADGVDALEKIAATCPEVVLLDIGMPGMDGYEVARQVRREPWGKNMLLVALTGWGQENDRREAYEAGFDLHLTKPADAEVLEALITSRRPAGDVADTIASG